MSILDNRHPGVALPTSSQRRSTQPGRLPAGSLLEFRCAPKRGHGWASGLSRIELRIISSLVRHRKPSPRFFESLLARAGCEPTEVLFIGDKADTDVAAANRPAFPPCGLTVPNVRDNRVLRTLAEIADRLGKGAPSQFPGHQSAHRNG